MLEITTARVVAIPTPSAPPFASRPGRPVRRGTAPFRDGGSGLAAGRK